MKINHFNIALLFVSTMMLTGCLGHCADFNCTRLDPRWVKAVDTCTTKNRTIVLQVLGEDLGYKSLIEVQDSKIGQHISSQCIYHSGKYDIHKDKQYGHLFVQ
ncbi:TPA: hypothetical protein WGR75_001213 [Neisseria meningitidis]|uniref:hypothetical protein n=1 Tax=Neisseria meningitidis TaxID=487 RepID=UPI000FCCA1C0|nr:hypothetical protein [Neisseria meningitidis]MCL4978964.1 hypothetical protein [Neisseria meningitidis]MCL4998974.1 hypothetical protein [Neisseria meningitidis]MCL5764079.1 hypothetical protein [Neisseria meningitidis]MCL5864965.1 hypothetical protein [Neisseria meningitidis]MCL5916920.1 hypothetical protein [Neisseria meningitidis]